jgi:hypothetical protein
MKLIRKLAICAALTAAFLLGAAAPSHAQAIPIVNGQLTGGPSLAGGAAEIELRLSLVELPDGSFVGGAKSTNRATGGWFMCELTSFMFIGNTFYAAGTITATHNTEGHFAVGDTHFVAVKDNGNGNGPVMDEFIQGNVPAAFGPLTIQQIIAIIGPPPPAIFRQGISGNIKLH